MGNLVAKYHEALENPRLLSLTDEMAVIDVRLGQLWSQMESQGSESGWIDLSEDFDSLVQAQREGKIDKINDILNDMGRTIKRGSAVVERWRELTFLMGERRKLFEAQSRHQEREKNYVPNETVMLVMGAIMELILQNVSDRETRGRLSDGLENIIESTIIE